MLKKIHTFITNRRVLPIAIGVVGIVWISLVASVLKGKPVEVHEDTENQDVPIVELVHIGSTRGSISTIGVVEAVEEATLLSEVSGPITTVRVGLGDRVAPGDIIATLSNATQHAAVLQAEASVESAQANLDKTKSGVRFEERVILEERVRSAENTLTNARVSVRDVLQSGYSNVDDAIRNKADVVFRYPRSDHPELRFSISTILHGYLESAIKNQRRELEKVLNMWADRLTDTSINERQSLNDAQSWTDDTASFLDDLSLGLNSTGREDLPIESWKVNVASARSLVAAVQSSLRNAESALEHAESEVTIAEQNLSAGTTGGRPEDVRITEASVKQAQAGLMSARAALEKTIIRSPISGSIARIPVSVGDFIGPSSPVAVVTSEGYTEVRASVPSSEHASISRNAFVRINKDKEGYVRAIAPVVSGSTGQVEVLIGIDNGAGLLVPGERVEVEIDRSNITTEGLLTVPISAVKLGVGESYVFQVEDGVLQGHRVELGPVVGGEVVIKEGISSGTEIVRDARGLQEGERVNVQ